MWVNLQQELRRALLKSSISGKNNGSKQVEEEENVALASKGPSQGRGEQRKKKMDLSKVKYFRCGSLVTTVPSVLSGRKTRRRSKTSRQLPQRSIGFPPGWRNTS